eukprot:CAMPEP_0177641518 /NCGR_PEP_ID=MMETSP0447-20121125/7105_1 /TAXON_ID=0 /ORGANISM="Stygamoeba regulata, Strain BSH-02190019" /LENGTH=222 /DNA_ID=CAMNT_0019143633 /DNA_START=220 /DNA_END=885 /DNA_ORIENTATION=-
MKSSSSRNASSSFGWKSPYEEDLISHCRRFLGPSPLVFRQSDGLLVHLFPPVGRYTPDAWVAVTIGLSGFRMPVPLGGSPSLARAELLCYVSADWRPPALLTGAPVWDIEDEAMRARDCWPVDMLCSTAAYIVESGRFVSRTHGLPNFSKPGQPFCSESLLTHAVVVDSVVEPLDFYILPARNAATGEVECVTLQQLVPLTREEYAVKVHVGYDALARRLQW